MGNPAETREFGLNVQVFEVSSAAGRVQERMVARPRGANTEASASADLLGTPAFCQRIFADFSKKFSQRFSVRRRDLWPDDRCARRHFSRATQFFV